MKYHIQRLCRRLFHCKHRFVPYKAMLINGRYRTIWKCTRCGKEEMRK